MDSNSYQSNIILQQSMSVKNHKKSEAMMLRSRMRGQKNEMSSGRSLQAEEEESCAEQSQNNNQIYQHKQDENGQKSSKHSQTLAPADNQIYPSHDENVRPRTRSHAQHSKRIPSQVELPQEEATPEPQLTFKNQEETTQKKIVKLASFEYFEDKSAQDLSATAKKITQKPTQNYLSPYTEVRRSYRKTHKRDIISVPYRKGHDTFQAKIVGLLNKIESGKMCQRDFETLLQKMHKMSIKDMFNKFIISGIRVIIRLSRQMNLYDSKLIDELEHEEDLIKDKIREELHRSDFYEENLLSKNQEVSDLSQYKFLFFRRLYNLNKKKYPHDRPDELKARTLMEGEKIFSRETTYEGLVKFVKKELSCHKL